MTDTKKKLKETRFFLCPDADSYAKLQVPGVFREYNLKLADCHRSINWSFECGSAKERKASLKKLKKFRELINALYQELEEL